MRQGVLALLAAAAVLLPGATVAAGAEGAQTTAALASPNVVVIMTDDQTVESLRVMTNVKRLLRDRGATFSQSFVTYALCCPSRATFLTGQYAHNHGVMGNAPPSGGYAKLDHTNTLPVWLQQAGYYTAHLGKYLNGYGRTNPTEIPPGLQRVARLRRPVHVPVLRLHAQRERDARTPTSARTRPTSTPGRRSTSSTAARRRPSRSSSGSRSSPRTAAGRASPTTPSGRPLPCRPLATATTSPPRRSRRPPGFNERNVSDKPVGIRNRPLLGAARIAKIRENYQQRLESLLAVDEAVAKIVAALRSKGELNNTLIVFTSDNGFFHGEHRVPSGKVLPYEPSIRVPLIMRGPGIPAGLRLTQRVANIDLAPTIVDAAGATAGRVMDGRSLLPVIASPGMSLGRDLLVERGPGQGTFTALRAPNYFYAEYGNGEQELYDLVQDPFELTSRHNDPAYAALKADLAERLAHLRACAGLTCRTRP